ncbi:uncharacterized protein N7483_001403 [Penicillium malachiteum]|uniref:uncharacterized protein n=1 Tax=Penicillium malachiteum TaxID=1324776 RepID=UPI0025494191|nr:uncharacterized protein N7483_001403 [Penicillium malachiteum]KAJ5736278.1 hypothetical protein N7483_001403 [Penicillium malachiteum]
MHFSSAAALLAFSSISVTFAAPLANSQNDLNRRQVNYQIVNVDGDSDSSAIPEVETVTETAKSTVTAPGSPAVAQTVTVTATPSYTPSYTPSASPFPSSSTPVWHQAPPSGNSFMPEEHGFNGGFFRRGLNALGNPGHFAQNYVSSSSTSWPTVPTSLAVRGAEGWYLSSSWTPSSSPVPTATPLVAREFGRWGPSSLVPSSSSSFSVPTPSSPVIARQFQEGPSLAPSSSAFASSAVPSPSLAARQFDAWGSSSSSAPSGTPYAIPSTHVWARGYDSAPNAFPSGTPSSSASISPSATPSSVKGGENLFAPSVEFSAPRFSSLLY